MVDRNRERISTSQATVWSYDIAEKSLVWRHKTTIIVVLVAFSSLRAEVIHA